MMHNCNLMLEAATGLCCGMRSRSRRWTWSRVKLTVEVKSSSVYSRNLLGKGVLLTDNVIEVEV